MRDLVDDSGVVQNHKAYDGFGNVTAETNAAVDTIFGFTGKALDEATGLQNNWNRWYDASVGRWLSQDPIGFEAGDANVYRYVGNRSTLSTDPSGLVEPDPGFFEWWIGGAIDGSLSMHSSVHQEFEEGRERARERGGWDQMLFGVCLNYVGEGFAHVGLGLGELGTAGALPYALKPDPPRLPIRPIRPKPRPPIDVEPPSKPPGGGGLLDPPGGTKPPQKPGKPGLPGEDEFAQPGNLWYHGTDVNSANDIIENGLNQSRLLAMEPIGGQDVPGFYVTDLACIAENFADMQAARRGFPPAVVEFDDADIFQYLIGDGTKLNEAYIPFEYFDQIPPPQIYKPTPPKQGR